MTNVLEAILNISTLSSLGVKEFNFGNNRVNNVGEGLELFIKDAFSGNLNVENEKEKIINYSNSFSFEGSKTRPPDLIIKGSDAIEVKKTESLRADLQLNSSYPKAKLFSTSPLINNHCRNCEDWKEKDIIYIVGHIPRGNKKLSSLWLIYGTLYAADEDVYTELKNTITNELETNSTINFSKSNEIGRVNFVDPLKITNLRIRGMWLLQPPIKVYNYVYEYQPNLEFQLVAIIPSDKYYSFPETSRIKIENSKNPELIIKDVNIKNPNNPVNLIHSKLITIQIRKSSNLIGINFL